jgi:hypothetical protein
MIQHSGVHLKGKSLKLVKAQRVFSISPVLHAILKKMNEITKGQEMSKAIFLETPLPKKENENV